MIYDSFMFNNEFDLLEIRLQELYDIVDKFIITESEYTFQGKKKSLHFLENKNRFSKFLPKIIILNATSIPLNNAWNMENNQRDFCLNYINNFNYNDNDFITQVDADEIISKQVLQEIKKSKTSTSFGVGIDLYYYYLNCKCIVPWNVSVIPIKYLKTSKPSAYRNQRHITNNQFKGGWHFSYFGGPKAIINKLESYSHTEFNTPYFKDENRIAKIIQEGGDLFNRGDCTFKFVSIDNSYPKYVIDNIEKYRKMGWIKE